MNNLTDAELRAHVATGEAAQEVLNQRAQAKADAVQARVAQRNFDDAELRYAATARCRCGAGLCYPRDIGPWGAWYCSDVLTRRTQGGQHDEFPFAYYATKSEDQPSAEGRTTRPCSVPIAASS